MSFLNHIGQLTDLQNGQTLSGQQLRDTVESRAQQFSQNGMRKNDRVVLLHANSASFFIDLLAIWLLGGCAVPVDKSNPRSEILALAEHCSAKFEIAADNSELKLLLLDSSPSSSEACLILYTSGTSGMPKAVVHTVESIQNKLVALKNNMPIEDFSRSLCFLPTYFGHGLIGNSLFALLTGCHLFISEPLTQLNADKIVQEIDRYQITFLSSVPSIWQILKKISGPRGHTLRRIHCASALFSEETCDFIQKWCPSAKIFNIYGLTEFGSWLSGAEIKSSKDPISVGHGWGSEFKIQNPDECGRGIVMIKSNSMMSGYLNLPDVNQKIIHDGWFVTGDLGEIKNNELHLFGRYDDVINKGGLKILPLEIEQILLKHQHIKAVCVFAVPHDILGQAIAAAFVSNIQDVNQSELESWCRQYLPSYRVPNFWFRVSSLPVTNRGKIDLHKLRQIYSSSLQPVNQELELSFEKIVRQVFNLTSETNLNEIKYGSPTNWDSIRHITLFIKLKSVFNVSFEADEIVSIDNFTRLKQRFFEKINKV